MSTRALALGGRTGVLVAHNVVQLLMAVGSLCGGLGSLLTVIIALVRREKIFDWFRSVASLREERDDAFQARDDAVLVAHNKTMEAASWQNNAEAIKFDYERLQDRVAVLERDGARDSSRYEKLIGKFNTLVHFAKDVVAHASYLETKLAEAKIVVERKMPELPEGMLEEFGGE